MEINLLLSLNPNEQAALQAALVTHGAPNHLVTLALTGACKIRTLAEAKALREWLQAARAAGDAEFACLEIIESGLRRFGV